MRTLSWMNLELKFEYEVGEGDERELLVKVKYLPGRMAPPCRNPDSPAFSDSGDPDELEIVTVVYAKDGGKVPDELVDDELFIDRCYEEAQKMVESLNERDYP